jgi:hypothetical protein
MRNSILISTNYDLPNTFRRWGLALTFLVFPMLFIISNMLHPNLLHFKKLVDGAAWISHFNGQNGLHLAHVLEFFAAPVLIVMAVHYMKRLQNHAPWLSLIGGSLSIFGACILAGSKGAFCLTLSAFDLLPADQLTALTPALDLMLQKQGWLVILNLLPLLPFGFLLLGIALFRSAIVPKWQAVIIITGSVLLLNPEIEIVNLSAAILFLIAFVPYTITLIRRSYE